MRRHSLVIVFALVAVALASFPRAQAGRKVYISVDLEGISGVNGNDQTSAGQPEYARARKLMADDANAAIRGAFAGAATEGAVNDPPGNPPHLPPQEPGAARAPRSPRAAASPGPPRPRAAPA